MKLITTLTSNDGTEIVKVYRDSEWDEYVCKIYVNQNERKDAAYYTDDREDAIGTARMMLKDYQVKKVIKNNEAFINENL